MWLEPLYGSPRAIPIAERERESNYVDSFECHIKMTPAMDMHPHPAEPLPAAQTPEPRVASRALSGPGNRADADRQPCEALAVVLEEPRRLALRRLALPDLGEDDLLVEVSWSGISTGTERLLWSGEMPAFPGMGYPLVPGYESVGEIAALGPRALEAGRRIGERVFVPGASCYGDVRGLFGGASARLVVPASRAIGLGTDSALDEEAVLLALAATARHALAAPGAREPDLIVGHGVLGRLLARLSLALGGAAPVVWEQDAARRSGALGYDVIDPAADSRHDYGSIYDVSGDPHLLDTLIGRLAHGGELVLAGFYSQALSFAFPPAFMREARMRVAAEWAETDLPTTLALVESGRLRLDGLITHRRPASEAADAYVTAFDDPECLKMVLDWRNCE